MAFPWIFEESFDDGTKGDFGAEADTGSLLDFPHYTTLAAIPGMGLPFRGAYCMRIVLGDTNVHTLLEEDLNIADTATAWVRFYLFVDKGFAATADDIFNIFEWQSTSNVIEAAISMRITAATDIVDLSIADGVVASSGFVPISKGVWHAIEALFTVDAAAGNDGVLELYVDGTQTVRTTGHNVSLAISHGVLGTQDTEATTTGTLLFDQFVFDDLQIYPFKRRYVENILVTKDQHIFVGNGRIDNITLLSGSSGTDSVVKIFDTDVADTNDASNIVIELKNTAGDEVVDPAGVPAPITRGAYVVLSGTGTRGSRALVKICRAQGWGSDGAIRNYAARRTGS